jgi:GTP-binding protein
VYGGQIIGEHCNEDDIVVNAQKTKRLTNLRAASADRKAQLAPAVKMSLEEALEYINQDEYVEATPKHIRLRKAVLDVIARKKSEKVADSTS